MEDSLKSMLYGMIKENDRKQEKTTQNLKKINHSMKSPTHSINGSYGCYSTMRLIGEYDKNRGFNKLVDSGSTNNILDLSVAKSQRKIEDSSKGSKQEQSTQELKKINHLMKSPPISTHSINGSYGRYSTMRLIGEHDKNRELSILVDSGSTDNILDISVAKSLDSCKMTKMVYPLSVSVANGQTILCSMEWLEFEWSMQNQHFKSDFLCIPLSGCEMVLGIPWLITLGGILWNFRTLEMWFFREQKYQYLHGIQEETTSEYEISEKELAEAFLDFI